MRIIFLFIVFPIDAALGVLFAMLVKTAFVKREALFVHPGRMKWLMLISFVLLGISLLIHLHFAPYYSNIRYFSIIGIITIASFFRKIE